jgi:hypothetical protein
MYLPPTDLIKKDDVLFVQLVTNVLTLQPTENNVIFGKVMTESFKECPLSITTELCLYKVSGIT